eukprot:CAMPEP_0167820210 /NCGR_PEP_ID=MMETSP0112_2-20121227/5942_1 /TAXON_ID=91324 /ORGANISM="Lotharella globosa, Strain CCCM811" /LENGTH=102 /DNA_ID=CAMNT_0007720697 /DNA_START=236 /DNA_END=544 /DNA_ORIENTATION=-
MSDMIRPLCQFAMSDMFSTWRTETLQRSTVLRMNAQQPSHRPAETNGWLLEMSSMGGHGYGHSIRGYNVRPQPIAFQPAFQQQYQQFHRRGPNVRFNPAPGF